MIVSKRLLLTRRRNASVVKLSYSKHPYSIIVEQSSGHQIRFKKPESVRLKRMPTRRYYNTKRRRNKNVGRLRRLRRPACWRKESV